MKKLIITCSEDFGYGRIPNEIYSRLISNSIIPFSIISYYSINKEGKDKGRTAYFFKKSLPDESKLIKILEGIDFDELKLEK